MPIRDDLPVFGSTTYADAVIRSANYGAIELGPDDEIKQMIAEGSLSRRITDGALASPLQAATILASPELQKAVFNPKKEGELATRLVKVFMADPDPKVPLENRLLHKTEEFMTDAADQDLFYDIDIKGIVAKHNELRKTIVDKKASEGRDKDVFLEPVKASALRIQVITLATF